MKVRTPARRSTCVLAAAMAVVSATASVLVVAQERPAQPAQTPQPAQTQDRPRDRGDGGRAFRPPVDPQARAQQTARTAREGAAIDLTGYWVSIVNEDWRWRMVTPAKGDYASVNIVMNDAAKKVADGWDPATDGSCKAYGAAALTRLPTRLHITWDGDNVLKVDTDAGQQTRRLLFDKSKQPGPLSLQGYSVAEWERPLPPPPGNNGAGLNAIPPTRPGGSLKVITTNLQPAWLRKNGVPYSEKTLVTEYFDRFHAPNGSDWIVVTTVVEDPIYLTVPYITSTHFRREPDGARWHPQPCREAQ